jgi:hypothetical protein
VKKAEYKDGAEVRENFEKLAPAVRQFPKKKRRTPAKKQPKKSTSRRSTADEQEVKALMRRLRRVSSGRHFGRDEMNEG